MIRITVELVPFGFEQRKRIIGTATIVNDGSGTQTHGNYSYEFVSRRGVRWRSGVIGGFPRKRRNVWELLRRCLDSIET